MKNSTLKVALVAVATIMGLNGFAQNTGQWGSTATVGDYVQSAATPITSAADSLVTSPTDKITIGKAMPFFVWPSAAYNVAFDPTAAAAKYSTILQLVGGVNSSFAWVSGGGTITNYYSDGTTTVNANGIKNYAEISYAATGNKVIQVTETPAGGICPAAPVYFGVNVIAVPSASIDASAAVSKFGLNNVLKYACWSTSGDNQTAIGLTNANADEVFPFNVNVTYKAYNVGALDGSGNIVLGSSATDVTDTHIKGVDGTNVPSDSNPIVVAASGDPLVASQDYPLLNGKITIYEVTYNNVNGAISRKSDYIAARAASLTAQTTDDLLLADGNYANFSYYPAAPVGTKNYIISFPAPVTGPIYHIANNFAY